MHPTLTVPESAILIPPTDFEIRTSFLSEIKKHTFEGRPNECPLAHITTFADLCETIAEGENLEYVRLKTFRWSLSGNALKWLEGLTPRSLTTWTEVKNVFLNKFFPPAKTALLRQRITAFKQKPGEPLA
jgi:hypothetical protein